MVKLLNAARSKARRTGAAALVRPQRSAVPVHPELTTGWASSIAVALRLARYSAQPDKSGLNRVLACRFVFLRVEIQFDPESLTIRH